MSSTLGTLITYGRFGREIQRGEPDQGTTRTVYDRTLRPIWVQEASDVTGDDFWATIYDVFGRPTRIGKESDQSSSWFTRVPTAPTGTYGEDADEWRKKYTYDADAFGSGTTYPKGRLTKYEGNWDTESSDAENYEWYQYAREGWITKVRQAVAGFDITDTEYSYDTGGRLRKVSYDSGNSTTRFFLWYDYDSAGRLYKIYHATSDSKPGTATTEYTWNARGQVSQQVLGSSVQTVDFTYNNRGFLTKINDPASIGTDRFAMELGYDGKVTSGPSTGWSAQYNGNISQIRSINTKISASVFYYTFGYDSRDQLTAADRDSAGSGGTYGDVTYAYDDNGNFTTLNRGTSWTYNYDGDEANTNRVDDISSLTSDNNWDYDASGRQTKDTYAGFTSATYHFPGAAFHDITMSCGTLQMRYSKDNRRLQKKNTAGGGVTTDYIRDLEGRVLSVFEDNTLVERYVWGPYGLVAIVKGTNDSPTTYYTLNDHLGYVRTVVSTAGTAVAAYDYYPYGKDLRIDEDGGGASSRFRFGAKEYDTDLSLNLYYFEARFYNPDIGRFVAPDPARMGWSYYCFANDNPIYYSDPTGLSFNPWKDMWDHYAGGIARAAERVRETVKEVGEALIHAAHGVLELVEEGRLIIIVVPYTPTPPNPGPIAA
jgi:RHS repeat-associated protein